MHPNAIARDLLQGLPGASPRHLASAEIVASCTSSCRRQTYGVAAWRIRSFSTENAAHSDAISAQFCFWLPVSCTGEGAGGWGLWSGCTAWKREDPSGVDPHLTGADRPIHRIALRILRRHPVGSLHLVVDLRYGYPMSALSANLPMLRFSPFDAPLFTQPPLVGFASAHRDFLSGREP